MPTLTRRPDSNSSKPHINGNSKSPEKKLESKLEPKLEPKNVEKETAEPPNHESDYLEPEKIAHHLTNGGERAGSKFEKTIFRK